MLAETNAPTLSGSQGRLLPSRFLIISPAHHAPHLAGQCERFTLSGNLAAFLLTLTGSVRCVFCVMWVFAKICKCLCHSPVKWQLPHVLEQLTGGAECQQPLNATMDEAVLQGLLKLTMVLLEIIAAIDVDNLATLLITVHTILMDRTCLVSPTTIHFIH